MSDRRLQVFYSVARHLSFTKAAEALHMTQPAVTFQVRQLEEQFNTRLFDRTHNRINLTEAGDRVYHYAKQIFELYSRMEGEIRELTGEVSGVVIIGASTTIAEYMLPSLLGAFKRKFPDVVIRLRVSNTDGIVAMVENNEIDLGVVEAPVSQQEPGGGGLPHRPAGGGVATGARAGGEGEPAGGGCAQVPLSPGRRVPVPVR